MTKKFDPVLLIAIPLLGIVGGGYLSLTTISLTRSKEPWTSMTLLAGLGTMMFVVGRFGFNTTPSSILWSWIIGSIVYFLMASVGGFRQHIESFFVAHMIAFSCLMGLTTMDHKKQAAEDRKPRLTAAMVTQTPSLNPKPHSPWAL